MTNVTIDAPLKTATCPECDSSRITERTQPPFVMDGPEVPYYCLACAACFAEYAVRRRRDLAKYEHLEPADLGLAEESA